MITQLRTVVEFVLGAAALVGAGLSWAHARYTVAVAPIADGQPATTSLVLATTAAVLAVVGTARLRRSRPTS